MSSSSNDDYEHLNNTITHLNTIFNPETIKSYVDVIIDEEENNPDEASSSRVKLTRRVISRDHIGAATLLYEHYFAPETTYPPDVFRRRFRMSKEMFIRIVRDIHNFNAIQTLPEHFQFFHLNKTDCSGRPSFNIFQKCTAAIRQLAYSTKADTLDEYLQMRERTTLTCLDMFCKCVFQLYREEYLRKPTAEDVQRLTSKHSEVHGFPGMIGSIDCMHWGWKNCPVAWHGQYTRDDKGHPTIMLEAVASYDLWIWHAYFGPAGSNNDINVLNESDLFDDLLQDRAPRVDFTVNGQQFTKGYYLADGIYPEWQIIEQNARPFSLNKIKRIMICCVILHNMIVEDNDRAISPFEEELIANTRLPTRSWDERVSTQLRMYGELRDRRVHHELRNALVEHVWRLPENYRQH